MDEERNNVNEESRGLTFKDILFIIRKHWIAIICFIVACTAAGFIWSKVEPPVYSSTGSMLVSYESGSTTLTQDYTFSNYISSTYVSFIKENVVMDKVSEKLKAEGKEFTTGQLKNNTSVSNNALIIKVSFKSNDPEVAKQVAQTIMEVAQEEGRYLTLVPLKLPLLFKVTFWHHGNCFGSVGLVKILFQYAFREASSCCFTKLSLSFRLSLNESPLYFQFEMKFCCFKTSSTSSLFN